MVPSGPEIQEAGSVPIREQAFLRGEVWKIGIAPSRSKRLLAKFSAMRNNCADTEKVKAAVNVLDQSV
jgi:hypothetical protein